MRRRLLYGLLGVGIAVVVALFAGRSYLSSRITPEVVKRLQVALGVPVEIDTANVGIDGDSELQDVRVYEPEPPPAAGDSAPPPTPVPRHRKPWIRIGSITSDVSILSFLRGNTTPSWVRLSGVAIALRFDKDDNLLTHLPAPHPGKEGMPEIIVEDGSLTIEQEGREPLTVAGIRGNLISVDKDLKLKGTINDANWGNWQFGGKADPAAGAVDLALDSSSIDLTTEKLKKLPFLSPAIWQQVSAEAKTPVRLNLTLSTTPGHSHCRVEVAPTDARVRVRAIELNAEHVAGKLIVDDQLVTLAGVTGRVADGTLGVSGTLDFRVEPTAVTLDVRARDVVVQHLPRSWDFPDTLDGKLTGAAHLALRLTEPSVQTDGSTGEGVVTGVSVLGLGKGEARVYLHAGPGRISFRREPPGKKTSTPLSALPGPANRLTAGRLPNIASAIDTVSNGMESLTGALATGATSAIRRLREFDRPLPPGKPPTYFESNLSLQDVDLGELVRRAKLPLPFLLDGKLSFQLHIGFPVDTPRDLKSYRFHGEAQLPVLNVAGFKATDVKASIRYHDGVLSLDALRGNVPFGDSPAGTFQGSARYEVVPAGDIGASLRFERLPLALLARLIPGVGRAGGALSGSVEARTSGGKLDDPASWRGTAVVRSDATNAYGLACTNFSATITLDKGTLTASDIKGTAAGIPATGKATLTLAGPYPFAADFSVPGVDLALLQRLMPTLRPPVPVTGHLDFTSNLRGSLRPRQFDATGTVRTRDLTVGTARLDSFWFHYSLAPERVTLTDVRAGLFRGAITGTATIPLRPTEAGLVSLQITGVDARVVGKAFPQLPISLEGITSGTATVKLPGTAAGGQRATSVDVELSAPDLVVQGVPTSRIHGNITYRGGTGTYRLEGDVAGGTFKLDGPISPPAGEKKQAPGGGQSHAPQSGTLRVQNVRIGRLVDVVLRGRGQSPLQGSLDADLTFGLAGPDGKPDGHGRFALGRLRWGDLPLTDRLTGEIRLRPDGLHLSDVSGALGAGEIRLSGGYRFDHGGRGDLHVQLFNADAAQLLAPFPGLAGLASGPIDLNLRLSGGREFRGSGLAVLTRGRVAGVEVSDWRIPFEVAFVAGAGQFDIHDSSAQVAAGRALGRASLTWGDTLRLEGSIRFFDANLRGLLGRQSEVANYAGGRLTGTFDFGSEQFRSVNDLNGNLSANLSQALASSVPILEETIPFLGFVGGSGATRFQNGELRARLSRGVFHIQHFTLTSSLLQLIFEGDVALAGALNLEVTAGSGNLGPNSRSFELLGLRLPAIGPLPLTLIVDASAFFANRIVHLRVTGSVSNPVVRVEPTSLLSQEAIRYFLSRSGLPVTP
jgi:hypothetical protein